MLFTHPHEELSDEEIADVLRQSVDPECRKLAAPCRSPLGRHLCRASVDGLRSAGLIVIRPVLWRLHP
jgi:hypothetical protein